MNPVGKKVLILTYYWPPAGGVAVQRWLKFAVYLKAKGWTPVIFTAKDADYPAVNEALSAQVPPDMEVHRIPIPEPRRWVKKIFGKKKTGAASASSDLDGLFFIPSRERTLKQNLVMWIRANLFIPDARVLWRSNCVQYISRYIYRYGGDFLVTTGPPHSVHLSGLKIKAVTGITWVADFRDPWTDIEYFGYLPLTAMARRKHLRQEEKVVSGADGIITVSHDWLSRLKKYPVRKSTVLTNGYDPYDFAGGIAEEPEHFIVSHTGTLYGDRFPVEFFEALKDLLHEHPEWAGRIRLIFAGKTDTALESLARSYGLEEITGFRGFISHREAVTLLQESAMLLLLINRVEHNQQGRIPAKLFEYLYARKPVLMLGPADGDAAAIIRDTGAGQVCSWNDVPGIKQVLAGEFRAFSTGKRHQPVHDIEKYDRGELTNGLIDFFMQIHS